MFEGKNGLKLPSYGGDNVHGDAFDEKSKILDPQRMIRVYRQSMVTLNLLRTFVSGGLAAMQGIAQWEFAFHRT